MINCLPAVSIEEKKKNHVCIHCTKAFCDKNYLRKHIKTIHEGVRYKCEKCDKDFARASNLKNHIEVIHFGQV